MKKDEFFIVYSHYDKNGQKSRLVKCVRGEVFLYGGHNFGLYHDSKEGLWKLIDLLTGKQLASGAKKEFTRSRIMIPQIFYDYEMRTQTKDYEGLMKELRDLIEQYLIDNPPPSPDMLGAGAATISPVAAPLLRDPKEDDAKELTKRFYEDMGLAADHIDFEGLKRACSKNGGF